MNKTLRSTLQSRSQRRNTLKLRGRAALARTHISGPRDWADLGRWVLAEAMHRALIGAARPAKLDAARIIPFLRIARSEPRAGDKREPRRSVGATTYPITLALRGGSE